MKYFFLYLVFNFLITVNFYTTPAQKYGGWKIGDSLKVARADQTSTLLPNGNILAIGGNGNPPSIIKNI